MNITSDIGPFAIIPEWILYNVPASALKVWAVLARHANLEGVCHPSLNRLAELTGLSKHTVLSSISMLERIGALEVEREIGEKQNPKLNHYHLNFRPPNDRSSAEIALPPSAKIALPPSAKIALERKPSLKKSQENITPPYIFPPEQFALLHAQAEPSEESIERHFEEFWEAYPGRRGTNPKALAKRRFVKLVKSGVDPQTLANAASRYYLDALHDGTVDTEYVQQAATFLGPQKQTWKDYVKEDEQNE